MTTKLIIWSWSKREQVGYFQVNPLDYEYTGPDPNDRIESFLDRVVNDGPHYHGFLERHDGDLADVEMGDDDLIAWVKTHLRHVKPKLKMFRG